MAKLQPNTTLLYLHYATLTYIALFFKVFTFVI